MSEFISVVQKEIAGKLALKAVVIDGRESLSIDGTHIVGIDGKRALELFAEGVEQDVFERGPLGARKLYREKAKKPSGLGKVLQTSVNLSRMLDADMIVDR